MQEINGWTLPDKTLVPGFAALKNDGSTACGCWIYSGVFPDPGENRAAQHEARGVFGQGWGFAWPADRRIIYNRASARPGRRRHGASARSWCGGTATRKSGPGLDTPDFTKTKPPDYTPPPNAQGDAALAGDKPFILHPDGFGWIWVPFGLNDGPLPAHYEPWESPIKNPVYPGQENNPVALEKRASRKLIRPTPRPAISLCSYNIPSDGASHLRSNESLPLTPGGTAAGTVLRNLARVGG